MTESKVPGHIAYELDARSESYPDFKVVTFENGNYADESLTYAEIVIQGRKIAHTLKNAGIGKGDKFAMLMRNHPEFVYAMYSATLLGAVMVPIDPRTKGDRLAYLLRDSGSQGLFCTSEFMANAAEVINEIDTVKMLGVAYKEGMPSEINNS